MGKKHKKKSMTENILDILNIGEQLLRTGEIRMNRKVVINMDELTKPSIDKTIGSRIDCLEDKSEVLLDKEAILQVNASNADIMQHYRLWSQIGSKPNADGTTSTVEPVPTITIMLPHKDAIRAFSIYDSTPLGKLMRNSNLSLVMRAIGENWKHLINENEGADCILYVPELVYFNGSNVLNTDVRFNLLVYVTRKKRYIYEESDVNKNTSPQREMIHNVLTSAVKLGCKSLIIDPMDHPLLQADGYESVDAWYAEEKDPTIRCNVERIHYCIPNENDYIIFWRGRR